MSNACGNGGQGTAGGDDQALVADSSAAARPVDGFQVIHLKDGGRMEGEKRNGIRVGTWSSFHANGGIRSRRTYVDGKEEGTTEVYHENGMTYYSGQYHQGNPVGTWQFHNEAGEPLRTVEYDSLGTMLEQR
jgi:antitoxin component YwqK of YwqJK toxin-antitoxin module